MSANEAPKSRQPMTVTVSPESRAWVGTNHDALGFRSESHLVETALEQLRKKTDEAQARKARVPRAVMFGLKEIGEDVIVSAAALETTKARIDRLKEEDKLRERALAKIAETRTEVRKKAKALARARDAARKKLQAAEAKVAAADKTSAAFPEATAKRNEVAERARGVAWKDFEARSTLSRLESAEGLIKSKRDSYWKYEAENWARAKPAEVVKRIEERPVWDGWPRQAAGLDEAID